MGALQLLGMSTAIAVSMHPDAKATWCFNPQLHGPASRITDIHYTVPRGVSSAISRALTTESVLPVRTRNGQIKEYYVRAGVLAPDGLLSSELYEFAGRKTVDFQFYYNAGRHDLMVQSFVYYDAPLVQHNVILRITTRRQIKRVYVQCSGGV